MRRIALNTALLAWSLLHPALAQNRTTEDALVYEQPSNQWFEAPSTRVAISSNGEWALFSQWGVATGLISLPGGKAARARLSAGLDNPAEAATFCGEGNLARKGERSSENGWFLSGGRGLQLVSVPAGAVLRCSPDASLVAFYHADQLDGGLYVGPIGKYENYPAAGRVTGVAFSPDGRILYATVFQLSGASTLLRITPQKHRAETVATGLDAPPSHCKFVVSPDGRSVFLPLASNSAPDNAVRQQPEVQRWLKIYRLDLATGNKRLVTESAGTDNSDPAVAAGYLYWHRTVIHDAIAVVPVEGGVAKEVVAGGEVPMWSPDGRRISYVFGGWRLADWALNLDVGVFGVNGSQKASSPKVFVSGYHEDFPAAWSPDGRWIAFHSHRSKSPVGYYGGSGSTDDIYLRRAEDIHAPEKRLTDFGWETWPASWSPDGRKLMFASWVRGGQAGIAKIWIITLDPDSGKVLHTDMLPLPQDIHSAQQGAWSRDGKEIAIEDHRGGENRALWIVRADGTQGRRLLDYKASSYNGLDWTSDDKMIVYGGLAGERAQLFRISRDGGVPYQLSHDSGNLMHPQVSPDGRWIACTRLVQSQQIWRRPLD